MSRHHAPSEARLVWRNGWLQAVVPGANDGLVSTASLIVGVAAASAATFAAGAAAPPAMVAPIPREVLVLGMSLASLLFFGAVRSHRWRQGDERDAARPFPGCASDGSDGRTGAGSGTVAG